MKLAIMDISSECDQIISFPGIWQHLLTKSLIENFIFYALPKVTVDPKWIEL